MDKIEKIRQEIERLKEPHEKNLNKPMERGRIGYAHGCVDCCDRILSFIDSLELEEESSCPKELDYLDKLMKEVQKYYSDNFDYITSDQPTLSILTNIARYFTEWQKEQMMKEAVEGYVTFNTSLEELDLPCVTVIADEKPMEFYERRGFKLGDKVKIITLKAKEESK